MSFRLKTVLGIALIEALLLTILVISGLHYLSSSNAQQLEQRAAMLEADLENKAALAAVDERGRIAREMHDIIAHGMSTVVVQAQAGQRVLDSNPDKAREVLNTIEHIGRDSVDEMRRMLGVLRRDEGEPSSSRNRGSTTSPRSSPTQNKPAST